MPEKEKLETKTPPVLPPNPQTEKPVEDDPLKKYRLTPRELDECRELLRDIQELANLNAMHDLQKADILQKIVNLQGEQARTNKRILHRLGFPDNTMFQIDFEKGIIAPMGSKT